MRTILPLLAAPALLALDLQPEVHCFASFGYLETTRNDWLGNTTAGTGQFWEAAANAVISPLPQVRVGGQLFARDFQRYDNGRAQLDWLFAEWRPLDQIGVQAGRVKYPLGLYNESRDVDAARATIFLPVSVYPLRARDLRNATDGGKVFGYLHLGALGSLEYTAYAGKTELATEGGFATYLDDAGFGKVEEVGMDYVWGGMLHWHTPVEGLAARVTATDLRGLHAEAPGPGGTVLRSEASSYFDLTTSLLYEHGPLTLVGEAIFSHGTQVTHIEMPDGTQAAPSIIKADRGGGAYLSGTWHLPADVDTTIAIERAWDDMRDLHDPNSTRLVLAARWGITEHWSVKAEYQRVVGEGGALLADNPGGVETPWDLFALKTTVDF